MTRRTDQKGLRDDGRELLERLAAETPGVSREEHGSVVRYAIAGRPFAESDRDVLRFGLRAPIARAALRTPGTRRVAGRQDWVSLAASPWDRMTADRAEAWFEAARRDAIVKRTEAGRGPHPGRE